MELQTCGSVCGLCIDSGREEQQEEFTRLEMQKIMKVKEGERERKVYSFRLEQCRRFEDSDKNVARRSNQLMARVEDVNVMQRCNSPAETARFYSPEIRMQKSVGMPLKVEQKRVESYELKSLFSPRAMQQPKINFHFNHPQALPSKMTGKRIRTIEEQTEYSSKHSQILFKTTFEIPENTSCFPRSKGENNHIIFQQPTQSSKLISESNSLHTISQCKLSQEHSHPAHIEQYNHGTTFESIITSTEIKSRNSSRLESQFKWLRDPREIRLHNTQSNHSPQLHPMHRYSNFQETNKVYLSPKEEQPERMQVDPNMFYQPCRRKISPRVSVLSFSKHQQAQQNDLQQQLRDVIDHNFLISQACSKTNSPKVSINPSLKNISEHSQKKSPFHSRDNSWQLGPLMSTRAKMKRTNTIESIQSFSSEMVSCLDIKFMQKNKGRRGVSRLV